MNGKLTRKTTWYTTNIINLLMFWLDLALQSLVANNLYPSLSVVHVYRLCIISYMYIYSDLLVLDSLSSADC